MQKILIIKLGALGDVVRTTPILRVLKGEISWVTHSSAVPLLKSNPLIHHLIEIKENDLSLKDRYDLVLNVDEDIRACRLATRLKKKELIGAYESSGKILYTDSSTSWFDMSLISRFSKKTANKKKWENSDSYQEILFSLLGMKFKGEEYILPLQVSKTKKRDLVRKEVGIETRAGERWVAKQWAHFPELLDLLKKRGTSYHKFHHSPSLLQFINQINQTDFVVTTDSLTLHLALGLKKKIIALFTCTSPQEIYGYSRTIKVVSPLLRRFFYSTNRSLDSGRAIDPKTVLRALRTLPRMKG